MIKQTIKTKQKMKTKLTLLVMGISLFYQNVDAQELIISKEKETLNYDMKREKMIPLNETQKGLTIDPQTIANIDNVTVYPEQISNRFKVNDGFELFQGIENPFNKNQWVYMERIAIGASAAIKLYDKSSDYYTLLLDIKNESRQKLTYKPIAWSDNANELYVEGIYLDSADEHEGIWILNTKTKSLSKINIPFQWMRTPIISPDRKTLIFSSTLDSKIDVLHGNTDIVYAFNLQNKSSKIITQAKGESFVINGWKQNLDNTTAKFIQAKASTIDYYLPWDLNKELCVSRHGTPAPTGDHTNVGRCNNFGPGGHHTYAAVDFATSTSSDDNVRAAASGTVSFAGISSSLTSGYGRLVIITHSDGTRTYYGHNSKLLVNEGQAVTQGQVIALEGTTGGSTGDHIHFEWRAAGGSASTIGTFKGIGQPRQDFRYRSNNGTVISNIPTLTAPAASANVAAPVVLKWTSSLSGASYRLQVSKVNTGWTAANGFTTDATFNSNTPVNYSAAGLITYTWPNADTAVANRPVVGNTYYWTVRSFSAATGTSSYSPVRSFKVTSSTARISTENTDISVYPNPSNGQLSINFNSNTNTADLNLYDLSSNVVFSKNYKTIKGNNTIKEDISNLKSGNYILLINDGEKISTQNVVIQNK
jgi:murein DD-endopeptidase MepM/ murein hydrolase activator NlpD